MSYLINALPVSRWTRDEELVVMSQTGSKTAAELLLSRYRTMVESKARTYYLQGAEHEDVLQEGMVGLVKAMRDYRNEGRAHFRVFAELCVTRQIITAIKATTRYKHQVLTESVSLFQSQEDDDGAMLQDCLANPSLPSLLDAYCQKETLFSCLTAAAQCLSEMEKCVCRAYLQGKPYRQIAQELRLSLKTVDNALQRIRIKLSSLHTLD